MTFQDIIHPICTEEFFSKYFEKEHLLIKTKADSFFEHLLSIDDIDRVLFSISNHHPQFRLADHSQEEQPDALEYTVKNTRLIDPIKYVNAFEEGKTLVMSGLQHKVHSLRKLTNQLEFFFKHRVQTNIYLTPPQAQGFSTHYDTHDVFIFQFEGSKTWRIYDNKMYLADRTMPFEKKGFVPGKVVDEFLLEKGDVLYIPRGVVHDAYCTHENSGHITTGLLGKTWAEHISEMLLNESKNIPELRKFTKFHPTNVETAQKEIDGVIQVVNNLIGSLQEDDGIIEDFYSRQKSHTLGQLTQIMKIDQIDIDTKVQLREKDKIRMVEHNSDLELKFYDLQISMPSDCKDFLNQLMLKDSPTAIKDIDSILDVESKILTSKQLSKVGVLEIMA